MALCVCKLIAEAGGSSYKFLVVNTDSRLERLVSGRHRLLAPWSRASSPEQVLHTICCISHDCCNCKSDRDCLKLDHSLMLPQWPDILRRYSTLQIELGSLAPSDSQKYLPNDIPATQTYVPYHLCADHHSKISVQFQWLLEGMVARKETLTS